MCFTSMSFTWSNALRWIYLECFNFAPFSVLFGSFCFCFFITKSRTLFNGTILFFSFFFILTKSAVVCLASIHFVFNVVRQHLSNQIKFCSLPQRAQITPCHSMFIYLMLTTMRRCNLAKHAVFQIVVKWPLEDTCAVIAMVFFFFLIDVNTHLFFARNVLLEMHSDETVQSK